MAQQPFQSMTKCRRNVENVEEIRTFRRKHHRGEKGRAEIGGVSALSAGVYTTTKLVMVDRVKGGGREPTPSPGWAEFTIMMECTPESGHCQSICTGTHNLLEFGIC
jgi:hypothetical protein